MNADALKAMTKLELERYIKFNSIDTKAKTAQEMRKAIMEARERVAHIELYGIEFDIPIKRFRSSDTNNRIQNAKTDEDYDELIKFLLGEEKHAELIEACTDETGEFDIDAYSFAVLSILGSEELKN